MTFIEMRAKNSIETRDRDFDFTVNPIHRESSAPSNSWRHAIKLSEESESFRPDLFFDDKPSKPKDTFKSKSVKYLKRVDASMMTVGAIVFVGDTSRGVLFPLLSTLCTQLGGSVIDLGYLVAMFSIGRLIVTAPFGYLSDRYRHKLPLLISSFILVLGSIIWANAFTTNRISVLYVAQFLLGVGSGSLGVTRSFVVEQCEPKKRTETLALITALQYAGFTVSPIVGSWLHSLGGGTSLYMSFALPSYLIALLALWCLIALLSVFENIPTAPVVYTHSTKSIGSFKADDSCVEEEEDKVTVKLPISSDQVVSEKEVKDVENRVESAPSIGISSKKISDSDAQLAQNGMFYVIVGMFLLNISTKGSIAVYETLGAQIGLIDYKMSSVALGALISASGAVGFCQLMLFSRVWTKHFSDIKLMLGGIAVMILAQLIGLSYGQVPHFGRYVTSVVLMYAFGYPIGHTAVLGAFSKIQKSGPQAALMGWFATSGSFSRIILPIISGYLDRSVHNSPFNIVLFMLALSYLGIILLKSNMKMYIEIESTQNQIERRQIQDPNAGIWRPFSSMKRLWSGLNRQEQIQTIVMIFLMVFSIVDIIQMSGGSSRQDGYDIGEDLGLDVD